MTESYRCIGWTRMYYIQGRTKPEDKFVIYGLKSHTILSITPTEFKSGKWNVINLVKTARDTVKCLDCAIERLPQYDADLHYVGGNPQVAMILAITEPSNVYALLLPNGASVLMPQQQLISAIKNKQIDVCNATVDKNGFLKLICKDTVERLRDNSIERVLNIASRRTGISIEQVANAMEAAYAKADAANKYVDVFAKYLPSGLLNEGSLATRLEKSSLGRNAYLQLVSDVSDIVESRCRALEPLFSMHGLKVEFYGLIAAQNKSGHYANISCPYRFKASFAVHTGAKSADKKQKELLWLTLEINSSYNLIIKDIQTNCSNNMLPSLLPLYYLNLDNSPGELYLQHVTNAGVPKWFDLLLSHQIAFGTAEVRHKHDTNKPNYYVPFEMFEYQLNNFYAFDINNRPSAMTSAEKLSYAVALVLQNAVCKAASANALTTDIYNLFTFKDNIFCAAFTTYECEDGEISVVAFLYCLCKHNAHAGIEIIDALGFNQCDEFEFETVGCNLADIKNNKHLSVAKCGHLLAASLKGIFVSSEESLKKHLAGKIKSVSDSISNI